MTSNPLSEIQPTASQDTRTTMPAWVRPAVIIPGIVLVAVSCLALVRTRGQMDHIYNDLTRHNRQWNETTALNYASLVHSLGRLPISFK
jgi:hypothetical protein